jgi:hypothetical protein|nr:MAG TPA: hypothetical protein [Caudoviricetes sp.]
MKKSKFLTGAIALSTLAGVNTFSQDKKVVEKEKLSSLSCSIDSKVRTNLKKQIKDYGKDDTVVIEVPAECRRTVAKNNRTSNWEKKTMYIDIKTAKSIQRNPDANEIVSTKGSRYIEEAGSYVMNGSTYQLKANFSGKNHDVENNDDLYGVVQKNLAKSTSKEKTSSTEKKPVPKKKEEVVKKPEKKEPESKIVKTVKKLLNPKKEEIITVSQPKASPMVKPNSVAETADKLVTTFGTPEGEVKVINGKIETISHKQEVKKVEEKKTVSVPKKPASNPTAPSDNEIENIIKNAGKKWS